MLPDDVGADTRLLQQWNSHALFLSDLNSAARRPIHGRSRRILQGNPAPSKKVSTNGFRRLQSSIAAMRGGREAGAVSRPADRTFGVGSSVFEKTVFISCRPRIG
jgi:hypothetical protein